MIISLNFSTDPALQVKFQRLYDEMILLQQFFQNRNFGEPVNEIAGSIVCKNPYQLQFVGLGQEYSKRKKLIIFLFKIEMDFVISNDEPLVRAEAKKLLVEAIENLSQLNVKGFNFSDFLKDFNEFLQLLDSYNLEELQSLLPKINDETLKVYDAKLKKILKS